MASGSGAGAPGGCRSHTWSASIQLPARSLALRLIRNSTFGGSGVEGRQMNVSFAPFQSKVPESAVPEVTSNAPSTDVRFMDSENLTVTLTGPPSKSPLGVELATFGATVST